MDRLYFFTELAEKRGSGVWKREPCALIRPCADPAPVRVRFRPQPGPPTPVSCKAIQIRYTFAEIAIQTTFWGVSTGAPGAALGKAQTDSGSPTVIPKQWFSNRGFMEA